MCHDQAPARLPEAEAGLFQQEGGLAWREFGSNRATASVALLPDIYDGSIPFYRALATQFAAMGLRVYLMEPFHPFGELPEPTREAAFARRGKLKDGAYLDALEGFLQRQEIGGVVGFCIGGLFVFELARRGYRGELVAFYPFPQGLPNQDPLPVPYDYLPDVRIPQLVLLGEEDAVVGAEAVERLSAIARDNPAIDLQCYPHSGHGFLADLDSEDARLRANAEDGLARCQNRLRRLAATATTG